jgi:hypothetical protein
MYTALAVQLPVTSIGTAEKWLPSAGLVIVAGSVTGGPWIAAVIFMSWAPALKVEFTKKAPTQSSRKIIKGYGKKGRLLDFLTARFLAVLRLGILVGFYF